jgi:hypothetical protein
VRRFADRGAISAAYVGIGMGLTIAVSFLLVIPIEAVIWLLAVPSGMIIGYYANVRSDRRLGPWRRILSNAAFAGIATGLTVAVLLIGIKALFFYADNGYPDFNRVDKVSHQPIPPYCDPGAACVLARYVAAGHGAELTSVGITDPSAFTGFYWREQFGTSLTVLILTTVGGLIGGGLYGTFRPKPVSPDAPETPAPNLTPA